MGVVKLDVEEGGGVMKLDVRGSTVIMCIPGVRVSGVGKSSEP